MRFIVVFVTAVHVLFLIRLIQDLSEHGAWKEPKKSSPE